MALQVASLCCERDGRELFRDLSFELQESQLALLTGPNGSGKSTLLRCIAGLFHAYTGQINSADCLYVGHRLALNPLLSVGENLLWYAALGGVGTVPADLLAQVGLAGFEEMAPSQLSAGQQRRASLARLLLIPASLWLLDEPHTALDRKAQELLDNLIQSHRNAGGTILCATHQNLSLTPDHEVQLGLFPALQSGTQT